MEKSDKKIQEIIPIIQKAKNNKEIEHILSVFATDVERSLQSKLRQELNKLINNVF